eukprot:jgi/Ulvmu1/10590/UM065_0044.1
MASQRLPAHILLRDGRYIPTVGFGTFRLRNNEAFQAATAALLAGYLHIDTASIYKNHEAIGRAVRESRVPREQIFITSKLSPYEQGTQKATAALAQMLQSLGLQYIDLVLIHWPGVAKMQHDDALHSQLRLETWRCLEEAHREGKARSIGVSNFEIRHLEHLIQHSSVLPSVNQIEVHPCYQQVG